MKFIHQNCLEEWLKHSHKKFEILLIWRQELRYLQSYLQFHSQYANKYGWMIFTSSLSCKCASSPGPDSDLANRFEAYLEHGNILFSSFFRSFYMARLGSLWNGLELAIGTWSCNSSLIPSSWILHPSLSRSLHQMRLRLQFLFLGLKGTNVS